MDKHKKEWSPKGEKEYRNFGKLDWAVGWAFLPTRLRMFVRLLFAFSASYFSLLAQRISNQKKCTPASACFLCYSACRAAIETQPGSSHKA
jgi:hypothetical protein